MCGIFGYIGKKDTAGQIVLDGLKLLEYRGYDSWGIAAKSRIQNSELSHKGTTFAEGPRIKDERAKSKFVVEKHVGKIGDANLNSEFIIHNSSLSIGHTRWATHGGVTEANAHPHLD